MSNVNQQGVFRAGVEDDNNRAVVAANDGALHSFDPKVVETVRLLQLQQQGGCGGGQPYRDTRNRLGLGRFLNPVYWTAKIIDHGLRQHCMRLGPNAYGSFCVKKSGPAQYNAEEVFHSPRSLFGFHGTLGLPFSPQPPLMPARQQWPALPHHATVTWEN